MVNETCSKIEELGKKNELKEGQYAFLTYLLGKKEMTFKDISIITLSLFADGLSTVKI